MRAVFTLYLLIFYLFQVKIGLSSDQKAHKHDIENPQEKNLCMICLDELNPSSNEETQDNTIEKNQLALKTLECQAEISHIFHQKCLNRWIYEYHKFSCPICRKEITPSLYQLNCHGKIKEIRRRHHKPLLCLGSCLTGTAILAIGFGFYTVVSAIIAFDEAMDF